MSKSTVTRLFVGAILALAAGIVVAVAAVVAALADGVVSFGGPGVVSVDSGAFAGTLAWLVVAALVMACGEIAALASWAGALLNTARLADKTWFAALLVLGLLSFGWVAMVAYVVAGPDGTAYDATARGLATADRA